MLRYYRLSRRCVTRLPLLRRRAASSSTGDSDIPSKPYANLKNPQLAPPPPPLNRNYHIASLTSSSPLSKTFLIAAISAAASIAAYNLYPPNDDAVSDRRGKMKAIYLDVDAAIERSNESICKVLNRMKQTGVAASVLWQSLRSVLSSANDEVRAGFELRVAALLADIVAASDSRRAAIVSAGGGAVVDW